MRFTPSQPQIDSIMSYAAARQPIEACGVIANGAFIPVTNKATDIDAFVMDMREFLALKKTGMAISAIVHSHVYAPPIPSPGDLAMCEATGLPWLIVGWPTGKFKVIEPSGYRAPLIGRAWAWGTHDCFGLVRDALKEMAGVEIQDFNRDWMWWEKGENIIEQQYESAGFIPVTGVWKHCDVIGMRIRSPVVNHVGIFLKPDVILHQLMGRPSVREIYGGVYLSATTLHLRHRELV